MTLIVQNALDPQLVLPKTNGGTGTTTPALVAGSNVTLTGTWPNQTIAVTIPASGTVTSVGGTGTVNGLTLTGTVTASGNLTLGGTLSNVSLSTQVTGTLPVLKGGTGVTTSTGTGSVVLSADPSITGTATFETISAGSVTVGGNLTVSGTITTVNSTTVTVADKNLELGSVTTPTNATANGGGITLRGATDKTFNWLSATSAWTSSEHIATAAGKTVILGGATSGSTALAAAAVASGTVTLPSTTGTLITTGDTGTVTSAMLSGSIANAKLANSTISGVALGSSLNALTIGTGLTGTSYDGSGAVTIAVDTASVVTLTGTQSLANKTIKTFKENVTLTGAAPAASTNFDVLTQPIAIYSTANANFTVNVRGNATTTLNSALAIGESITVNFFVPNGATAYYPNAWAIDGSAITPKYQGGTAYTAGNASATDLYVLFIVKTADATWSAYVSQTKFG